MITSCYWCHKNINVRPSYIIGRVHKFCSQLCNNAFRSSPENTFWRHILKTDTCWLWMGPTNNGYGRAAQNRWAHQYSYEIHYGPIPTGLMVRHSCHVRACVNPAHLSVGTRQDNSDDMVSAGRSLTGIKNPNAKLGENQILEIINRRSLGESPYVLASEFMVSYSTVRRLVSQ